MAITPDTKTYPRPDFQRANLHWESLNGPWHFLFDDDDAGLAQKWQHKGLPDMVQLVGKTADQVGVASEGDTITQKIAAGTQELIKDNYFSRDGDSNSKRQIQVPFVFQSPASGVHDRGVHEVMWYERGISDPRSAEERHRGDRVLLRFGAVDYDAKVWVDGKFVGGHRGGHVPWELDITDELDIQPDVSPSATSPGPHRLVLRVYDSAYDLTQPRGKQYWGAKPESIFYTPSGGIWQSVWLEVVPVARLADSSHGTIIRSNNIDSGDLHSIIAVQGRRAGQLLSAEIVVSLGGVAVATSARVNLPKDSNQVNIDVSTRLSKEQLGKLNSSFLSLAPLQDEKCWRDGVALWSPEHPTLYDLQIKLFDSSGSAIDEIQTTTGMRSINWTRGDGLWRLNGRPYFQALVLDQGYWPETFMTPPTSDSLRLDIELSKAMGMNGCRKHQKVEDPLFYYWADRLGYLVWGEMANAYQFSSEYVERFDQEWMESVRLGINHPSIVTWTPVNESWGYPSLKDSIQQRNHIRSLYYQTKSLDPTRSINDNCGWEHVLTDLTTYHDYADGDALAITSASLDKILGPKAGRNMFSKPIEGDSGADHLAGAPVMCTEFGGVNIVPAKAGAEGDREWGYTTASDSEDLLKRVEKLVKAVVTGGQACAFVYTQLADIEQEANGLYTFDRKEKLDAARVKSLVDEALAVFYEAVQSRRDVGASN
ncbi:beta-galactosidase [Plectosphaerella cucumerina]|uniref:Beta-galactosidase n=1 Tax=Plectosphaerella cucumerina TaxID=40658 RepID=A0A8K0X458_9PEZI|nr:beta-galactosidase [Plectosphaerella cucumerina]